MTGMSNFLSATIAVFPVFLAVGGFWFVIFKLRKKLSGALAQRDSKGRRVDETRVARSMVGNLPGDVGFVASLGRDAAPLQSLDRLILRPTWGLRLISLGFSALLLGMAYLSRGEVLPDSPYAIGALFGLVAYAVLFIAVYELRYDRHEVSAPGLAFQRVTLRWSDIASLQDNGHYLYILRTHDGRKLEVQKYLVGIQDFLAYAHDQIEYHKVR